MTIQEMQNNIINKYGFEHEKTIIFFDCCEDYFKNNTTEKSIKYLYKWLMKEGI